MKNNKIWLAVIGFVTMANPLIVSAHDKSESLGTAASATDVYQIVTYAVCYNCDDVFLVYPYFRGNSKKEPELALYQIQTASGNINLKILQVDILEPDIERMQSQLVKGIVHPTDCTYTVSAKLRVGI